MLTEPVNCSSCGAVSVNGGTIHCHSCYVRDSTGPLALLSQVREALGDKGRRMQDELLDYCRYLATLPKQMEEMAAELGRANSAEIKDRNHTIIRYRRALEAIRSKLSITDVPEDDWVRDIHGEIFALAAYALDPPSTHPQG